MNSLYLQYVYSIWEKCNLKINRNEEYDGKEKYI